MRLYISECCISDLNLTDIARIPFNGGHLKNAIIKIGIEILKGNKIDTDFVISTLRCEIEKEFIMAGGTKRAGF